MNRLAKIASALILAALASASAAEEKDMHNLPLPLYCSGGEPFWGLTIRDKDWAAYVWDNSQTMWQVESVTIAMLRPATWRVTFKGTNRRAYIFDEGDSCSDTDSDRILAYGLLLEDGGGLLRGCCDPSYGE
jgi:uncharacterized membrane protein